MMLLCVHKDKTDLTSSSPKKKTQLKHKIHVDDEN